MVKHYAYNIYHHSSKSSSEWEGGIRNVYHDPCQDWLDLINMKLTSPNYPEQYNPMDYCTWKITGPPGHLVTLDFERIDVSTARPTSSQMLTFNFLHFSCNECINAIN